MENGKDGVLTHIRELRARAAQLSGNEFYMTVQELDTLESSTVLSEEVLRAALLPIAARLERLEAAAAQAAAAQAPLAGASAAQPVGA